MSFTGPGTKTKNISCESCTAACCSEMRYPNMSTESLMTLFSKIPEGKSIDDFYRYSSKIDNKNFRSFTDDIIQSRDMSIFDLILLRKCPANVNHKCTIYDHEYYPSDCKSFEEGGIECSGLYYLAKAGRI